MKKLLLLTGVFAALLLNACHKQKNEFKIAGNKFLLNGEPFHFFSGEIHPYRIPPEYWQDRLQMIKAMGMNSVSIYMFWNVHEPYPGIYNFEGNADIAGFIKLAQNEGLWVLLRPSPYVCAEWEFGGYPWWLLKEKGIMVRSKDPGFIDAYKRYVNRIGKEIIPLLAQNGGPVVMVQIENEYGLYGNDKEYLKLNYDIFREAGFACELFTCDPPSTLENGHLPGVYAAVNGGAQPRDVINAQDKINGGGPYFVSEWYPAWFDVWGKKHHTSTVEHFKTHLDSIFYYGISLNIYMVHGGSNFGFYNGANYDTHMPYQSQTQSYDYDAPINEAGNPTPKFFAYRELVEKYGPKGIKIPDVPEKKKAIKIETIKLNEAAFLKNFKPEVVKNNKPLSFEDLNQGYGYVLYQSELNEGEGWLKIKELRDYGVVLLNDRRLGVLDRRKKLDSIFVKVPAGGAKISIFVENLGRINYGTFLSDNRKGITQNVYFDNKEVNGWEMYGYPFDNIKNIDFENIEHQKVENNWPVLKRGVFHISEVADTYFDMREFGKGSIWINGHHVGRYWQVGPQQTLYIPAPWLKKGKNEVMVFEMLKMWQNELPTLDYPILNELKEELFTGPTQSQQIEY